MIRAVAIALLAGAAVLAAPVPKEDDAGRLRRIYGRAEDPDKDCAFQMAGDKLHIRLPIEPHNSFNWKPGWGNSPRATHEIEGDFTATVRVEFPLRSAEERDAKTGGTRFASGGLIAGEPDEAVSLLRVEELANGAVIERFHRMRRWIAQNGANGEGGSRALAGNPPAAAFLRLARAGPKVKTAISRDGKDWTEFAAVEVGWKDKVRVGVIAENTFRDPFEVTFDEYTLTQPKK
ncbi:MAG: hypothetical protein K2V38_07705 [Gemmataceae bacterium]|nr:hypothetical protein [Gemmataceae bacterium]